MSSAARCAKGSAFMSGGAEALTMLQSAQRDFKALCAMLDPETFSVEIFGFHAQQTVEKGLKALIASNEIEYPHTHKLDQLILFVEKLGTDVSELWDFIELDSFAVQYRYAAYDQYDENVDREEIIEVLERFLIFVRESIKEK